MNDMSTNLKADYVRTGWVYEWACEENGNTCNGKNYTNACPGTETSWQTADTKWCREAKALRNACNAGLKVMIIVPPGDPTDSP
jgi:hypothetical protein